MAASNIAQFLQAGKASFKDKLENSRLVKVDVPEWDTVFYRPMAISMERLDMVSRAREEGGIAHMVDIILQVAKQEDGKPFFGSQAEMNTARKGMLKHFEPAVIFRVAGELSDALLPDTNEYEEAEKNSQATPSSEPVSNSQTDEDSGQ